MVEAKTLHDLAETVARHSCYHMLQYKVWIPHISADFFLLVFDVFHFATFENGDIILRWVGVARRSLVQSCAQLINKRSQFFILVFWSPREKAAFDGVFWYTCTPESWQTLFEMISVSACFFDTSNSTQQPNKHLKVNKATEGSHSGFFRQFFRIDGFF